jgi:D-alanine transaminase
MSDDPICYLNGDYLPLSQAKIPVLDRGFIFGDGVYEVVPAYEMRLFRFTEHFDRLERSLAKVGMPDPRSRPEWRTICERLLQGYRDQTGVSNQILYVQVTRGVAPRNHSFPNPAVPQTVFALPMTMHPPSAHERTQGVACVSANDFRWHKGDIKSTSLLGAVLARQMSAEVGAMETVLFRDGLLTEAAASNVWVVRHGVLLAPKRDHLKLEGIRYGLLEELCQKHHQPLEFRDIPEAEVRMADELLLTSCTKEVLPVTQLDGLPVGTGKPGPVYARLYAWYQEAKAQELAG